MSQLRIDFQSILVSKIYTILAGPGPTQSAFAVYSGLLSHHSPVLHALVSSERWAESKTATIQWDQWDADTVSRFLEFLYTGDYTWPDFEPAPQNIQKKDEEESGAGEEIQREEKIENEEESEGEEESERVERPITPITARIPSSFGQPPTTPALQTEWAAALADAGPFGTNSEQLLLAHARVYALAIYTQVTPLADLALGHFLTCLSKMTPRPLKTLIRYVYEHTDERMRGAVARWCVLDHDGFFVDGFVEDLVAEGGDFAVDVMTLMRRGLRWEKEEVKRQMDVVDAKNEKLNTHELKSAYATEKILKLEREVSNMQEKLKTLRTKLGHERDTSSALESKLQAAESKQQAAESKLQATESKQQATESKLQAADLYLSNFRQTAKNLCRCGKTVLAQSSAQSSMISLNNSPMYCIHYSTWMPR
ncbi:hypothetical protein EDC01DRAFT_656845 [Geopyxis carbonaria]|nr:hypothetical protein EDC01DRAFT_656845 [Geopyxis carbonaria]